MRAEVAWRTGAVAAALAAAGVAAAQHAAPAPAPVPVPVPVPVPGVIVAARAAGPVHLDGRLDEPAWGAAAPFDAFVESFPRPGAPGSPRTEVRVVYDEGTLYVGVRCHDPEPSLIQRHLARRDGDPTADRIEVALDTDGDGRTAADFIVNAAGVLRDRLLFSDVNGTDSWDAVWDAAVRVDGEGWTAELAIPFAQLRYPSAPVQRWGFLVRRHLPRTHQVLDSRMIPRESNPVTAGNLVVSRFGRLIGLVDLPVRHGLELSPWAATRLTVHPQYSDPARPDPRMVDPSLDLGLDLRTPVGHRLTLTGAINPDFGQVEADQVIQNLSNSEAYFPEKRPFFLEGLDLFQPVGAAYGQQQTLFYSRRIGLDAPILGAAKLTGSARPGLQVGLLDALVMGAGNASLVPIGYTGPSPQALEPYEADPDRRWRFRPRQPFHLGPENALPIAHPVTTNYLAGVARQRLGAGGATAGATFTAATPLEPRCLRSEFETDEAYQAAGCESWGGNALGLDVDVPGDWGGFGQVAVSQAVGGPAEGRLLDDGTRLQAGDLGYGGHFRAGKLGGEPWRWDVLYVYEDAKLDLNASGYQPLSNYQWGDLDLHYVRPSGVGPFHALQVDYNLDLNWSADGYWLPRGVNTSVHASVQLPGYQTVGVQLALERPQYDTREISQAGVPFERTDDWFLSLELGSDPSKRLQASGNVFVVRQLGGGAFPSATGWGCDLTARWRPHDRLETRLDGSYGKKPQGPRWIETREDGVAIFGDQHPEFISLTLRQQLVFTPRLSAQVYAQLFSSSIRWGGTFHGAQLSGRRTLSYRELAPVAYAADPRSHDAVLNLNLVLRWEYRLGSTLYAVYTRSQQELPVTEGLPPASLASGRLLDGPVIDSVMVKWSYWWQR
ncbi:MAG: DUF5916 domain-containing protein [Anaeromyxobacter sp.]